MSSNQAGWGSGAGMCFTVGRRVKVVNAPYYLPAPDVLRRGAAQPRSSFHRAETASKLPGPTKPVYLIRGQRAVEQDAERRSVSSAVGVGYTVSSGYDEYVRGDGTLRAESDALWRHLQSIGLPALREHQAAAEREIRAMGVTFGVDGQDSPTERSWPLDLIPRIVVASEWKRIEAGLIQRLEALNCFIDDCYHEQRAVRDGVVPAELVLNSPNFRPECVGARPLGAIWAHICGSDLVRDADGTIYVLEDNLRVPSGVSYMIENRMVAKRIFPELFRSYSVEPVDPYLTHLGALLSSVSPPVEQPTVVVLPPGTYNAAYF